MKSGLFGLRRGLRAALGGVGAAGMLALTPPAHAAGDDARAARDQRPPAQSAEACREGDCGRGCAGEG